MSEEDIIKIIKEGLKVNIKESEVSYASRDKYVEVQLILFGEVISEDYFRCQE